MYNGIGLQSARGSGTSGYIQSNASKPLHRHRGRQEFLKELQAKRNMERPPPRKANEEILEHERNRQIFIHLMNLRTMLEKEQHSQEVIQDKIQRARVVLREKFNKGQIQSRNKDTHVTTMAKEKEYSRLSDALGLKRDFKKGSAFDFDSQKEARLTRKEEIKAKSHFPCLHADCGKIYDSKERLKIHLKYKHPMKKQEQDI